jgi:uroporphyrin-III C-methyltransferase/precorrin-2 dehydrogenase/sirohydrochlorin ferrochelatase
VTADRKPVTPSRDPGQAPGTVALVGAGPGAPDLLTRRAVRRLEEADVVLYDALVDPEVLTLAGRAQRIFVGKRAGRPAVRQEFINRLLVRAAKRGHRVVRLKGGDPFVLGRGGEEALALAAEGVPFEVVPGISSAIAAPALAGIPVTHRGAATAFVVVAGPAPAAYEGVLGSLAPNSATVVVLMGTASAATIAARLIARGWKSTTPTALVWGASTEASDAWTGTLSDLRAGGPERRTDAPGTIVIGEVVRVGAMLAGDLTGMIEAAREDESLSAAAR